MNNMNISNELAKIAEEICDKYCKYPQEYVEKYGDGDESMEKLADEKCNYCPVCRLY